jgi:hypothetical protein
VARELAETRPDLRLGRERRRELDVRVVMARFAGEEAAVERGERGVVERLGEESHALAAPRLDERRAEERVDESRAARARGRPA